MITRVRKSRNARGFAASAAPASRAVSTARRSTTTYGHLYEVGAFADWYLGDRICLRAGYNAMWVLHVQEAVDQVNFDLSQPLGPSRNNGNIFFHGPLVELRVVF